MERLTIVYVFKMWNMMKHLRADSVLSWLYIGDFNEVLIREEQMVPNEREMAQISLFREAVDDSALTDIGYIGLASLDF
jgi:hypothetical protein